MSTDRNHGACGLNSPMVAIPMEDGLSKEPDNSNHHCFLCKCKCVLQVTCKEKTGPNSSVSIRLLGNEFDSSSQISCSFSSLI